MSGQTPTAGAPEPPAEQDGQEVNPRQRGQPGRGQFGRALIESVLQGSSLVVTVLSFLTAVVIGGLIIAFSSTRVLHAWGGFFSDPLTAIAQTWDAAVGAYVALFEGSVFNPHTVGALFQQKSLGTAFSDGTVSAVFNPLSETAVAATPLILAGLAVAIAFQAGLFNIGATSQFIGGAMSATWLGFAVSLPPVIHPIVCVLGGFVGGAVTGWVVGWLKVTTGAHEVIVTIMLNYVMQYLLSYLLGTSVLQAPHQGDLISPGIASDAHLPLLAGSHLRINAGFLLALACAAGVAWLMRRSTVGFEFRSVGANPSAARSAGMSVARTWNLSMLLAGGLAGLAASTVIQGTDFQLTFQSYGTYGIVAITVALLGRARPLGVVLAALLYGALDAGAPLMQIQTSPPVPVDIVEVLQALIVLFVAAPILVRAMYRLRSSRAGGTGQLLSKGWNA